MLSESVGGGVDVEEFSEIQKGEVVEGFEGEKKNFVQNAIFSVELVKLLQDKSYSTSFLVMMWAAEF